MSMHLRNKGVKEKLDYVQESNVNYLHLMPLLESPEGKSDGSYAVSDFRKVQPELGTMEDLESLADECRKKGISLCMDFVMNHTSEEHEWAKEPEPESRNTWIDSISMIIMMYRLSLNRRFRRYSYNRTR